MKKEITKHLKKKAPVKHLNVVVPEDLYLRFKQLAKAANVSLRELVIASMKSALE